jgi:hypothetical protein
MEGEAPMTLYELLRELVAHATWNDEAKKRDANAVVNDLETVNAFGTMAERSSIDHEHVEASAIYENFNLQYICYYCRICHIRLRPDTPYERKSR